MIRSKQLSNTAGTGAYTLGATPAGYSPIASTSVQQPYIAFDPATGAWEAGFGVNSAGTFTRVVVVDRHDNGFGFMDWPAGEREIMITALPDNMIMPRVRHKNVNTGFPESYDDSAAGYGSGSTWYERTTGRWYCYQGDLLGWHHVNPLLARVNDANQVFAGTESGDRYNFGESFLGDPLAAVAARSDFARSHHYAIGRLPAAGNQAVSLYALGDQVSRIRGTLILTDASRNAKVFEIDAVAICAGYPGLVTFLGTPTVTTVHEDAALATCAMTLSAHGVGPVVQAEFTNLPSGARVSIGLEINDHALGAAL